MNPFSDIDTHDDDTGQVCACDACIARCLDSLLFVFLVPFILAMK